MKEIMKEHGGLLATVAVTICILTIIFSAVTDSDGNRGIVKIIAAHMNTDGTDYNAYADYGAYQTEIAIDAPVIEYQGSGSLAPGTVNVADYVKAHDYNGQELAVKLLKFRDKDGNEILVPDTNSVLVLGTTGEGDRTVSHEQKRKVEDDQTPDVPAIFAEWKIKEGLAWEKIT